MNSITNKSKTIQRKGLEDGIRYLLTVNDGKSPEYLEMLAPIAANRQAVGR